MWRARQDECGYWKVAIRLIRIDDPAWLERAMSDHFVACC